jgi:hypothetical protein
MAARFVDRKTRMRPRLFTRGTGKIDDGLDPEAWRLLGDLVTAASSVDASGFVRAAKRVRKVLPDGSPSGRWMYPYLRWTLRFKVYQRTGMDPDEPSMLALARDLYPRFTRLLKMDRTVLERCIFSIWDEIDGGSRLLPGEFVAVGSVALGLLIDKPACELAEMRPFLAEYIQDNDVELRTLLGIDMSTS